MTTGVSLHDMKFDFMVDPELVRYPDRMTVRDLMESFRYERAKQDLSEGVPDVLAKVSFDDWWEEEATSIFSDIYNSLALDPEATTHPIIQAYLWHHAVRLGLVDVFNDTFPLFQSRFLRMWDELNTILEDDEPEDDWGDIGKEVEVVLRKVRLNLAKTTQIEQWALGNLWPFQLSEDGEEGNIETQSDAAGWDFVVTHNFINFESYDRHLETRFDSLLLIFEVVDDETGVDVTVQYQNVTKLAPDRDVFARLLADWTGRMADRLCQILTLSSFCVAEGVQLWTQDLNSLDFVFPYSHQPAVSFPYSQIQWDQIEDLVRSWATDTTDSEEKETSEELVVPGTPFDPRSFLARRSERIEQDRRERIQEIVVLIQKRKWIGAARMWVDRVEGTRADPPEYEVNSYLTVADAWMKAGVWYEAASLLRVLNNNWLTEEGLTDEWEQLRLQVLAERDDVFNVWEQFLQEHQNTPIPRVWERLAASIPELPPPSVREGDDGWVLDWGNPGVGLEVEIDGNMLQWGAHDHAYNRSGWGESPIDNLTEELLLWLDRVTHHNRARGDEHTF